MLTIHNNIILRMTLYNIDMLFNKNKIDIMYNKMFTNKDYLKQYKPKIIKNNYYHI